jgi:hypothetical protein
MIESPPVLKEDTMEDHFNEDWESDFENDGENYRPRWDEQ